MNSDILIYVPFEKAKLNEKEISWINAFKSILEISLRQITKKGISISNFTSDEFNVDLKDINENTKIIIQLLLNTNYTDSGLLDTDNLKTKKIINVSCHPEIKEESFKQTSKYNLFDESMGKPINLSDQINELKNEIWLKFLDIAYEIRKELASSEKLTKKSKGRIYLAETSNDQNFNRETIIRELEHLGFEILPKGNFPKDMMSFSEFVHDNLMQSILSIHLIGNFYAPLLNNIDISSIELQNDIYHEVASELKAKNVAIKRLVWIPPDIKPKSEKQRLYIESFKRNIELLKSTEIIQTPIEVFKTIIREKAKEIIELKPQVKSKENEIVSRSVYLISNNSNEKNLNLIKQELTKNKLTILQTTDKTNKIDLIQEHYRNLIKCDALLIDYSTDNIQWLNSKLSDILKSPGFGRRNNFLAKSILLNSSIFPQTNLQINDLEFINTSEKDIAKRLSPFIEKINRT